MSLSRNKSLLEGDIRGKETSFSGKETDTYVRGGEKLLNWDVKKEKVQ